MRQATASRFATKTGTGNLNQYTYGLAASQTGKGLADPDREAQSKPWRTGPSGTDRVYLSYGAREFCQGRRDLLANGLEVRNLDAIAGRFVRPIFGGQEFIKDIQRFCFWIDDKELELAKRSPYLLDRIRSVASFRQASSKAATVAWGDQPHRFVEIRSQAYTNTILVPRVSSESRDYLPVGLLPPKSIVTEAFALYDAPLWNMALIASRIHFVWIATVCGKLEIDTAIPTPSAGILSPFPRSPRKTKPTSPAAPRTFCSPGRRIFPRPSPTSTTPTKCPTTSAARTSATTRRWSASTWSALQE